MMKQPTIVASTPESRAKVAWGKALKLLFRWLLTD